MWFEGSRIRRRLGIKAWVRAGVNVGGEKARLRQLRMRVASKLSDDGFFPTVYDLANVDDDVFSIFILDQVAVPNQIGDSLVDRSP
jgi:hypothetical protein